MGYALKQAKVPKEKREEQVGEAARILDLERYLDRKPKNLSGGQRQRVAMGRAVVRHPKVFLMDEPLSNLDAKLRVQTRTELADLQARLGVTTVYVTHDQVEAMTMGHRLAVQNFGKLQPVDTPRTLYARPASRFVAGFIGSPAMNIGVRPEHLLAVPEGEGVITGEVVVVEELGSEAFVHIHAEHDDDEHHLLVVRAPGETDHRARRSSVGHVQRLGACVRRRRRPTRRLIPG